MIDYSVGTCKCISKDLTCEEALAMADEALYKEKKARSKSSNEYVKELLKSRNVN